MASVRSKRLWGPTSLAAGLAVYTVPAGRTALVKRLIFRNAHLTGTATISIGTGNSSGVAMHRRETLTPDTVLEVEVWWVLPPGQTVNVVSSLASSLCRITGYGAELDGVAP